MPPEAAPTKKERGIEIKGEVFITDLEGKIHKVAEQIMDKGDSIYSLPVYDYENKLRRKWGVNATIVITVVLHPEDEIK